jgi:hypothetical protein
MSSENLVKTSKKNVVILGAGAAGMVSEAFQESVYLQFQTKNKI